MDRTKGCHPTSKKMALSIGVACNFYNEVHALPGFLESAQAFFDDMTFVDCGPGGKPSSDGSLDILRSWGITPIQGNIDEGFGVVRSNLIRQGKGDWLALLDADERFPILRPILSCAGHQKYPDCQSPDLHVTEGLPFNQGKMLKAMLPTLKEDAIVMPRYHWFDFTYQRPCQNFCDIKDHQCRFVRNVPHMAYKPERKMHEHIVDLRTGGEPNMYRQPNHDRELAIFHYHNVFKPMEGEQNAEDLKTYQALDKGLTEGMWLESAAME